MKAQPRFAVLAFLAAALAAAPLAAQKPSEGDKTDPARQRWREQGIALCVAELRPVEGMTPDVLESICGCAIERLTTNRPAGALPELEGGRRLRGTIGGPVLACAFQEEEPELVSAVSRWLTGRQPVTPVTPVPSVSPLPMPVPAPEAGKPESAAMPEAAGPGFSLRDWWDGLAWPRWLSATGLPLWLLFPLGLLALILFARLLRRDSSRDLIQPPRHMRRTTARPGPRGR